MAVLTPAPKMQFFDINGEPLVGGKVYTYEAGTTTPNVTYTDNTGTSPNSNPIILNARGEASIWLGADIYKFKLTDANNVEIWTIDYISAPISGVSPALTGNVTIETASSSPALKITQTGTGLALRVQDEADPDSTPTVVDNQGRLGVGTASPSEKVDISGGDLAFTAAAGTLYAKVTPGAALTDIAAAGARALTFTTNSAERIRITDTGLVGIGKTPSAGVELDVVGDIAASVSVKTDTISELTSAAGVTIDGVLCKDSQVAPANRVITAATAVATTSGTSVNFGSIPSWVKRISIIVNDVSFSASESLAIQIGPSGGVETSGYLGTNVAASGGAVVAYSTDFRTGAFSGTTIRGILTLDNISGNIWILAGNVSVGTSNLFVLAGSKTLAGTLTQVTLKSLGGVNTFTAGSVNIFYE